MLLHYAEYHEERLQQLYTQYYTYCERGQYHMADHVLSTEILSNVLALRYAVWHKHFSTPIRILFTKDQSCTDRIYIPLVAEIKYPIKIK
jgi:hypothetical protein